MIYQIIWWIGTALEIAVLSRSLRQKTFRIYSFFYSYIAIVFLTELGRYVAHMMYPAEYSKWFWRAEIPTLILGCGIVLEIFRHVLAPYPGAEKFARRGGLFIFAAIFCFAWLYPWISGGGTIASSMSDLERDLRTVQAIFLIGIIGVIAYYGVPLGGNVRGMILGYVLYIGTSLTSLAVGAQASAPMQLIWKAIQPISYDITLGIWFVALWAYRPNPAPDLSLQLGTDYEALASKTRHAMDGVRSYLTRTAGS